MGVVIGDAIWYIVRPKNALVRVAMQLVVVDYLIELTVRHLARMTFMCRCAACMVTYLFTD